MDRTPKPMEQYVHFKGGRYQVLNLAEMEDTGETLVIYQALYGEGKIYARTLSGFVSEVDRAKYPDAAQHWRFRRVVPPEEAEEKRTPAPGKPGADVGAQPKPEGFPAPGKPGAGVGAQPGPGGPSAPGKPGADVGAQPKPEGFPAPGKPGGHDGVRTKPGDFSDPGGSSEPDNVPDPEEEEPVLDPIVLRFLDAESADEKLSVLVSERGRITDDMIDTMAFALGIEVEPGPVDERYLDLRECLLTISRYEMDRGRFRTT